MTPGFPSRFRPSPLHEIHVATWNRVWANNCWPGFKADADHEVAVELGFCGGASWT